MSALEETFTDKEFCEKLKIDRSTSLRWRKQGLIEYIKLPNGEIRYLMRHINAVLYSNLKEKKQEAA